MPSELEGISQKKNDEKSDSLPQLNQTPSSTYFVYNCYYPVM